MITVNEIMQFDLEVWPCDLKNDLIYICISTIESIILKHPHFDNKVSFLGHVEPLSDFLTNDCKGHIQGQRVIFSMLSEYCYLEVI